MVTLFVQRDINFTVSDGILLRSEMYSSFSMLFMLYNVPKRIALNVYMKQWHFQCDFDRSVVNIHCFENIHWQYIFWLAAWMVNGQMVQCKILIELLNLFGYNLDSLRFDEASCYRQWQHRKWSLIDCKHLQMQNWIDTQFS